MRTRALYGGSFDPIYLGHLAMIEIGARAHDELVVVVLADPAKTSGLFPPHQRVDLIQQTVTHLGNVSVTAYHGLIVAMNATQTGMPTSFIVPPASTASISSSTVRRLVEAGRLADATELVPHPAAIALRQLDSAR